jgi:hypothetical protein
MYGYLMKYLEIERSDSNRNGAAVAVENARLHSISKRPKPISIFVEMHVSTMPNPLRNRHFP